MSQPSIAASHALSLSRNRITAGWRRARPVFLVVLPILLAAAALAFAVSAWRTSQANAAIVALGNGQDLTLATDATPPVLLARVLFLTYRDRLEEAEPLVEAIERAGEPDLAARARYAAANARLRQAFGHLAKNNIDPAGPLVILARQDFRRALQAKPKFWDAKFNLDVASRLIRDFPDFDRKHGDDLKAEPKKIWTDIPGQPRGAP